jgi:hypothetical protein
MYMCVYMYTHIHKNINSKTIPHIFGTGRVAHLMQAYLPIQEDAVQHTRVRGSALKILRYTPLYVCKYICRH